jgi:hypothetical protein
MAKYLVSDTKCKYVTSAAVIWEIGRQIYNFLIWDNILFILFNACTCVTFWVQLAYTIYVGYFLA